MANVRLTSFSRQINSIVHDTIDAQIKQLGNVVICAGFDGSEPREEGEVSVAQRARINHYGNGDRPPSRQFVYAAFEDLDDTGTSYGAEIKQYFNKFISDSLLYSRGTTSPRGVTTGAVERYRLLGGGTVEAFGNAVGRAMVRNMQDAIISRNIIGPKDNAFATQKAKGKNHPLVDTGQMVNSLHFWISDAKEEEETLGESLTSTSPLEEIE